MRSLSASELLAVWERGQGQPPLRQALLLLAAACPEEAEDALAELPLGRRDERLLALRARTLGHRIDSLATCPHCAEKMELSFASDDLLADLEAPDEALFSWRGDGYEVEMRVPTTLDLLSVIDLDVDAESALLDRCIGRVARHGETIRAAELPSEIKTRLAERLAQADPRARIELALSCPACRSRCTTLFDVASYFWLEIEAWAERTLRDVTALARAYGWSESEILAMSAWRRERYLDLAGA